MQVDMRNYWPDPVKGTRLIRQDVGKNTNGVFVNTRQNVYEPKGLVNGISVIRLDETGDYTNPAAWGDAWEYRFDDRGVVECADWELNGVHKVFVPGKEILWGGVMNVGDSIKNPMHISFFKSTKVWPIVGVTGDNITTYEEYYPVFINQAGYRFKDVVRIHNIQRFYHMYGTTLFGYSSYDARHWHTPEYGVVQIDYSTDGSNINCASSFKIENIT